MAFIVNGLSFALTLFWLFLIARVVISWVMALSPDWTPRGFGLLVVEGVLTVTDPPVRLAQRLIPPITIMGRRVDLSVLWVFLAVAMLSYVISFIPV